MSDTTTPSKKTKKKFRDMTPEEQAIAIENNKIIYIRLFSLTSAFRSSPKTAGELGSMCRRSKTVSPTDSPEFHPPFLLSNEADSTLFSPFKPERLPLILSLLLLLQPGILLPSRFPSSSSLRSLLF